MGRTRCFCFLLLLWGSISESEPNTCIYKPPKIRIVQRVVFDFQNSPIRNTMVRLWSDGHRRKLVSEGKTDEECRFRLPKAKPGSYYLEFQPSSTCRGFLLRAVGCRYRRHFRVWAA